MRRRNRRGEGGQLRSEILVAATELLDVGGRPATLRAVARRVGIAAPSIYRHFPDQQALLLAVEQRSAADLVDRLHAAADDDPRQRLIALCRTYLDFAEHHPERYRAMVGVPAAAAELLTECLTACVAAGLSTSTDPGADAIALGVGLHGLAHQRTATRMFPWPADIAQRLTDPLARLVAV